MWNEDLTMRWDAVAVFVVSLLFFEGAAYMLWRHNKQRVPHIRVPVNHTDSAKDSSGG